MGAVDLVVQIESPPSVASALQRVGRAGHQVGEVSRGVLFPKHRGDLAQTAVAVAADAHRRASRRCGSRPTRSTCSPSRSSPRPRSTPGTSTTSSTWSAAARRSPSCRARAYDATLDLLSGRYPSDEFAELRPADRLGPGHRHPHRPARRAAAGRHQRRHHPRPRPVRRLPGRRRGPRQAGRRARRGDGLRVPGRRRVRARRHQLADRGHHPRPGAGHPGARQSRAGCRSGRATPSAARPSSAQAIGAFTRELAALPRDAGRGSGPATHGLDECAAGNLVGYLHEQLEATNVLPSDRTLLVERFRDELGDWRLVRPLPLRHAGARAVGAGDQRPAARALRRRRPGDGLRRRHRDPDPRHRRRAARRRGGRLRARRDRATSSPARSAARRCSPPGSASAPPARCCSPAATPAGARPLWQQRQRSAALLEVAAKYPSFPIVLEAVRECLQDVYDLPALVALMRGVDRREVQVVDVATTQPVAVRPAACCSATSPSSSTRATPPSPSAGPPRSRLDQGLLAELLGRAELRELLDPEVLAEVEAELQRLAPDRRARDAEGVADLLRLLGPLTTDEVAERACRRRRRRRRWLAVARRRPPGRRGPDRRRRALGRRRGRRPAARRARRRRCRPAPPTRSPSRSTTRSADLVARYARTHGPFTTDDVAARLGLGAAVVRHTLQRLAAQGRVLDGEFRPAGVRARSGATPRCCAGCGAARWPGCARRSSRSSPRRSAGSSRAWQHVGRPRACAASTACCASIDQLAGCPGAGLARWSRWCWPPGCATTSRPTSTSSPPPARCSGPATARCPAPTAGSRCTSPTRRRSRCPSTEPFEHTELHQAVLDALAPGGAWFFRQLADAVGSHRRPRAQRRAVGPGVGRAGSATTPSPRSGRSPARGTPGHRTSDRRPARMPRHGRGRVPARTGPPETAGRWALLPDARHRPDPARARRPPSGCSTGTAW